MQRISVRTRHFFPQTKPIKAEIEFQCVYKYSYYIQEVSALKRKPPLLQDVYPQLYFKPFGSSRGTSRPVSPGQVGLQQIRPWHLPRPWSFLGLSQRLVEIVCCMGPAARHRPRQATRAIWQTRETRTQRDIHLRSQRHPSDLRPSSRLQKVRLLHRPADTRQGTAFVHTLHINRHEIPRQA